ncbi:MAG TPA: hypothetical protein DDY39_18030 [Nitrospira sp.]|nr:hypothetical protein [Nitrospira sp.]
MKRMHMIIRLKQAISIYVLASALSTTVTGCQHYFGTAHAATYYVATTGDNSNPGTEDKPFRTIAHAVNAMVAGDTTYARGGTYIESAEVRFKRSGTSSAPIRLLNYPGETPTIRFTDRTNGTHRISLWNSGGYNKAVGWIVIEGFTITNSAVGIRLYSANDVIIRGNTIYDNQYQGILGYGTRILVDRNVINHNGNFSGCAAGTVSCNKEHGIYMNGTAITITNNVIYDNLSYGIQMNGSSSSVYDPSLHAGQEFAVSHNWIIANNTLAYNKYRAGIVVWGSTCNNARIENNIFYENSRNVRGSANGIDYVGAGSATGIQVRNNHFYASGLGGTASSTGTPPSDLVFTENIVNISSPEFVNAPVELPASPNFALTPRSPAIDKGLPPSDEPPGETLRTAFKDALLKARRTDFAGTARPQGRAHDIGAYEYRTDGDAQSPTPVQSVQIR